MTDGGDDGDATVHVERVAAPTVFEIVSDETRMATLTALGEAEEPLSFSTLYDRVPIEDSGNFSYHLDRLVDTFVRRTDDDRYALTFAGERLVGAVYAGTYTANARVDPLDVDWKCQLCGGCMQVHYAAERARCVCADCGEGATFPFPAGTLEQFTPAELPAAFARWYHQSLTRVLDGFCPVCAGRLDGRLVRPPGATEGAPRPSAAAFSCRRCEATTTVSGTTVATCHPIVEGFLAEHGHDITRRHPSQIWPELDAVATTVEQETPLRLRVRFETAGEAVRVTLGPDATAVAVERTAVDG